MTIAQKWVAGALVAAIALLAGSWFLLISPKRSDAADIQTQADEQLAKNDALQTSTDVLKDQKKDLPEQQALLAELQSRIPQAVDMPPLVRSLATQSYDADVLIVSMTPTAPVVLTAGAPLAPTTTAPTSATGTTTTPPVTPTVPSTGLSAVDSELVVDGGYFQIQRYLNSLEKMQRYVLVTDMTVGECDARACPSGRGPLEASLKIRVFFMPEATATTTGTTTTDGSTTAAPAA